MPKYTPKNKAKLKNLIKNNKIYIGDIDTRKITDMSKLFFKSKRKDFSGIENWDTSNVKNMSDMFYDCSNFNQNISNWNVSKVRNMAFMFCGCYNFNQPLDAWDVSNVCNISNMFYCCMNFNQNISNWNVSNVRDMGLMFSECHSFNQPLDTWDVSNACNMIAMLANCYNFEQSLYEWKIPIKTITNNMLLNCDKIKDFPADWIESFEELRSGELCEKL